MAPFRCGSLHQGAPEAGSHRATGPPFSRSWARYLQAGSAANLHRLQHATPKQLRKHARAFAIFASSTTTRTASRAPQAGRSQDSDVLDVVIVGAGISGLTLAQALECDHSQTVHKLLITESQDRVGGNIISNRSEDGFQYEEGPNSFQPSDAVLKLAVSTCKYSVTVYVSA